MTADEVSAHADQEFEDRFEPTIRTAIVVVHGMGEQLPTETLYRFVRTALPSVEGKRLYFSRPAEVTDSFEARRCLAYRPFGTASTLYGHTEFFEYHWSHLMTGNKFSDVISTTLRLLFRSPATVPYGLKRVWLIAWALLVAIAIGLLVLWLGTDVAIDEFTLAGTLTALGASVAVAGIAKLVLSRLGGVISRSFVDVVRYLDKSPRSFAVRQDIRKGMVDLLQELHDRDRYSRIVVVAHSLGAFIAYDGIAYLWPKMCHLHAGGVVADDPAKQLVLELQRRARALVAEPDVAVHPDAEGNFSHIDGSARRVLDAYREQQFVVWKQMRKQGNPWLVTDFISVGTPMYFADLLYTRDRKSFSQLVRNAELPVCPPLAGSQTVEWDEAAITRYSWLNKGRSVLTHGSPFAVVRWTNLFFPAENSWRGDWFGGPLRALFGKGILDEPVLGNIPKRRAPGLAHSRYFSFPNDSGDFGIAKTLQRFLALDSDDELAELQDAPAFDEETAVIR